MITMNVEAPSRAASAMTNPTGSTSHGPEPLD